MVWIYIFFIKKKVKFKYFKNNNKKENTSGIVWLHFPKMNLHFVNIY